MHTIIKSGDLSNMKNFDLSCLNGLMNVFSDIHITHMGVVLWVGLKPIYIENNTINFAFLNRRFAFDEVVIYISERHGVQIVDFTIQTGNSEIYMSVVLDV